MRGYTLKPGAEPRHDHNDGDLHRALDRYHPHIGFHPARDLLAIGFGLQHFQIDQNVDRRQDSETLDQ